MNISQESEKSKVAGWTWVRALSRLDKFSAIIIGILVGKVEKSDFSHLLPQSSVKSRLEGVTNADNLRVCIRYMSALTEGGVAR